MNYYWEYVRYIQRKELYIPFFVGSSGHYGLELWYGSELTDTEILAKVNTFMDTYLEGKFIPPEQLKEVAVQRAIVQGILSAYFEYPPYLRLKDKTKIIHVEQSFQIPIDLWGTSIDFVGTIDKLYESKTTGKLYIEDYKFKAKYTRAEILSLPRNLQVQLYPILVEKALGNLTKVAGVWYSIITKPSIRLKKTETVEEFCERIKMEYLVTPEKYFHRDLVRVNQDDRKAAYHNFKKIITDASHDECYKTFCEDEQGCLSMYGQACPYTELCNAKTDKEIEMLIANKFTERQELERGDIICY
jgi:hypothetical protein